MHPRSMYESNTLMYSISIQYCYICMDTTKVTTTSTPIRGTLLLLDILTVDKKYFGAVQPKCGLTVSVTESSLPDVCIVSIYHTGICAAWSPEAGDLLWEWTREQVLLVKVTTSCLHT